MSLGLSSTSDIITFDKNWHHLYSTSAGGKDLSNTHNRKLGLMAPKIICTKMFKKLSEKLRAKFPATTPGYPMVKFAHLYDTFLEVFQLQAISLEGQSLQQKEKKRGKRKGENNFNFDFNECMSQNVIKRDARGKI